MLDPFIQQNLTAIRGLMHKHHMLKGYLFGSSVRGSFNEKSDVDVLVEVDDSIDPVELGGHLWDLQFGLEELLGRKVDLLTSRSLKNPYFIKEIEETRELIYE